MSVKTSHRRAARTTVRQALAEVTCRPLGLTDDEAARLQARIAKAVAR